MEPQEKPRDKVWEEQLPGAKQGQEHSGLEGGQHELVPQSVGRCRLPALNMLTQVSLGHIAGEEKVRTNVVW